MARRRTAYRVAQPGRAAPGELVSLIVVHAISLPPGQFGGDGIVQLFTNWLDPAAHPYFAKISGLRSRPIFLFEETVS
jgi:AmpD protein